MEVNQSLMVKRRLMKNPFPLVLSFGSVTELKERLLQRKGKDYLEVK